MPLQGKHELPHPKNPFARDFVSYWDSIGFFNDLQTILPSQFQLLFEIARNIFDKNSTTLEAVDYISEETIESESNQKDSIDINRLERQAPVSDKMEIGTFRHIYELKQAMPRELAFDELLDIKLLTKSLLIRKYYESSDDHFNPITTHKDEQGKRYQPYEQKCYVLMDRSNSMEFHLRSYYAKCIVAEFFRRKASRRAQLFFRSFNSKTGELHKAKSQKEFSNLIEHILLTTTDGHTDIQAAVFQAIQDIKFEKEAGKAEILVVTDGISIINGDEMKKELGSIPLHVLKIGRDMPDIDLVALRKIFTKENLNIDPGDFNFRLLRREMESVPYKEREEYLQKFSDDKRRAYEVILTYMNDMFSQLRGVADRYIEIEDLNAKAYGMLNQEKHKHINEMIDFFETVDLTRFDSVEKEQIYKQSYLFSQYLEMLLAITKKDKQVLEYYLDKLAQIKDKLLKDPHICYSVMNSEAFNKDSELQKLAAEEAKEHKKNMKFMERDLSIKQMKNASILLTMDPGKGNAGQLLLLILLKLLKLITYPFRIVKNVLSKKSKKTGGHIFDV